MLVRKLKTLFTLVSATLVAGTSMAGTLDSATAMPHLSKLDSNNTPIYVKHIFSVAYASYDTASCGVRMEYSDGTPGKNFTLTQATTPKQFIEERNYKNVGIYKVTVSGSAWGNYKACFGSQTSTTEIKAANSGGKVGMIETPSLKIMTAPGGMDVPVTIHGSGSNCVVKLFVNNQPGPPPVEVDVKTFPVTANLKFPDLTYEYKYKVHAVPGTPKPAFGPGCDSDVSLDLVTGPKPAVKPYITGMYARSSPAGIDDVAHQDEAVQFAAMGNVNNDNDPAQQCGWSLFLVDGKGQGKPILRGNKFSASQTIPAGTLAAFEPGAYTLHLKSSSWDDAISSQSCGSSADKKFTVLYSPGIITDVKLKSYGHHVNMAEGNIFNPAHDDGILEVTPVINGRQCNYRVTRTAGGASVDAPAVHVPGTSNWPAQFKYGADKTFVTVTVHAMGTDNIAGMGCLGSVSKTIVVRDNPTLLPETK